MIWSMAREQVRSQRKYVAWAAGVVSLAVGVASYGALMAVELDQAADATNHALVLDTENSGFVGASVEGAPLPDLAANTVPLTSLEAAIDATRADGLRVGAQSTFWAFRLESRSGEDFVAPWVTAAWGDVDWDAILTEGAAPGPGEVALSEAYADELGVAIGDTVEFYDATMDGPTGSDSLGETATVSGIARSPFSTAGVSLTALSDVWISPDDIGRYVLAETAASEREFAWPADVLVTWDGHSAELDAILNTAGQEELGYWGQTGANDGEGWVWLATGVLALGSVAMAFAFGRAQAQSRTQWVATARALGATRRHVVLATLAEAGVLTAFGAVVGYVLGTVGATAHLLVVHAQVPAAGIASVAAFSPVAALLALGLALLLSLVIAGVPAFWAARVSPSAALKPENDITTAEVGRKVNFWPVTLVWGATGVGAVASGIAGDSDGLLTIGLILLFVALSPVVANEALRWIVPTTGRWLAKRPEKVALVAGDSLHGRPRQFTVSALLVALGAGSILAFAAPEIIRFASEGWAEGDLSFDSLLTEAWPDWVVAASLLVLGSLVSLATVIAVATASVTEREAATREALGITVRQSRGAAGLAQGVTLLVGTIVGVVFGALVTLVQLPTIPIPVPEVGRDWELALTSLLQVHVLVVGVALALAIVSAVVVALAARTTGSPAERQRAAARV